MNNPILNYSDDGFPTRASKLIANGQCFSFRISGAARAQLEPHIVESVIDDPPKLGLKPKLQALLAILMLADARGQSVLFEVAQDEIVVHIGADSA